MTTLRIDKWNEGFLWTAWSAHPKSHLADLLKLALPSLGQTERKRLAKSILQKECKSIELEDSSNAYALVSFLQGLGATVEVTGEPRLTKSLQNLRRPRPAASLNDEKA
jgi:hypothetical protein